MDEKNSYELNRAHEIDLANGGQGLQNDEHGDLEAVKNKEKTPDQIERMMSQDEIFNVVKENGIYTNMLAPCLSANIFLDGKIMSYFTTPMKPIDLEEKVTDVMQLVLMETSKEQNGVVFKPDGSIDVGESIKQAALNGMPAIPLLRDTMPEGMADELAKRYYDMNRTGMDAAIFINRSDDKLVESMFASKEDRKNYVKVYYRMDEIELREKLGLSLGSVDKAKKEHEKHERYHEMFGEEYTDEQKETYIEFINDHKEQIEKINIRIQEIAEKLKKYDRGTPEHEETLRELSPFSREKARLQMEIDMIGNIEHNSFEEIKTKGLAASLKILKKLGITDGKFKEVKDEITQMNTGCKKCQLASRSEMFSNTVERNYLTRMAQDDASLMKTFKELDRTGTLTEDERNAYMIISLRNYVTYMNLQNADTSLVLSPELLKINLEQALSGLIDTIPNVKNTEGVLDWNRIVDTVNKLPGYEHVTLDNIKGVMLEEKSTAIVEEIQTLAESSKLDIEEHKHVDEVSFVDGFKEENKEMELCKYVNYARHLEAKGIENAATRMFKMKLKKENLEHILDKADELYEDSIPYIEETMDNYKRGLAFTKYKELKKYTKREISNLTNEEKGSIVSAMIAAYDISRDKSDISLEIQAAAKDTFATLLGDVFDERGDIDDEKLFAKYKAANPQGKYGLGKAHEDMDAFWDFHEMMSLTKVQSTVTSKFMDIANDREIVVVHDTFITEEEARKTVDERGENLDVSAITDPQKPKSVDPSLITRKEAEAAVERQGEAMRVDDPKTVTVEHRTTDMVSASIDKKKEEQGNTVRVENVQVGENGLVPQKKPNLFSRAWSAFKEKVSNLFGGNSGSNNTDTTSNNTSGAGGVVKDEKKAEQVQQSNNNWVQTATLNVKEAQDKFNEAKDDGKNVEPEDVTK